MQNAWIKIFSTEAFYKAEIVKGILEQNDIKTFEINKRDSMHTHLSNGEIEIYVEPEDVIRAKHLLSKKVL